MPDNHFAETLEQIKEIKEIGKKPLLGLVCYFTFGFLLTIGGIGWMYIVYKKDPSSIKMTTTLPIFLITLGISFVREAYRDC